jgi:HK97 gp10 family phage protein
MTVTWDETAALARVSAAVEEACRETAEKVGARAKASTEFSDKTGKLRSSIKVFKSKFPDGGYIVHASSPHAHLVEYGHGGPAPAPAHPFLRPAQKAEKSKFNRKVAAELERELS